ncbi:MAG: hypothetical protein NUV86_06995, partial [Candidatus Scalindua sp.]|nr:hypothetical protein [Candidatus Scalindua sp.]
RANERFVLLDYWLPTVLSFERNPILESSRKRGAYFYFHLSELLRTGKETKKQNPSSGSDIEKNKMVRK